MIDKNDPYMELASTIVLKAIEDYIKSARSYRISKSYKDRKIMYDYKKWFYSSRFKLYCSIHPDRIMEHIRKELAKDEILQ